MTMLTAKFIQGLPVVGAAGRSDESGDLSKGAEIRGEKV